MKIFYNKRGDVPVMILVIGVFVVCGLAMMSFVYSGIILSKSFQGIDSIEKANVEIEKDSLNYYYDEINKTKFSINLEFDFFKESLSFSIEYFGS